MAPLQDLEMERLSDLLAEGKLSNAQEIASLLRVDLGEQAEPRSAWSATSGVRFWSTAA
jgi:hypothetical protein